MTHSDKASWDHRTIFASGSFSCHRWWHRSTAPGIRCPLRPVDFDWRNCLPSFACSHSASKHHCGMDRTSSVAGTIQGVPRGPEKVMVTGLLLPEWIMKIMEKCFHKPSQSMKTYTNYTYKYIYICVCVCVQIIVHNYTVVLSTSESLDLTQGPILRFLPRCPGKDAEAAGGGRSSAATWPQLPGRGFSKSWGYLQIAKNCPTFDHFRRVWNSFRIFFLSRFGNFLGISWLVPFA